MPQYRSPALVQSPKQRFGTHTKPDAEPLVMVMLYGEPVNAHTAAQPSQKRTGLLRSNPGANHAGGAASPPKALCVERGRRGGCPGNHRA